MVLKPVRPSWINSRSRMKDRRNASQIKNINMFKRLGRGKGNWGTELEAQMIAVDSENVWEMDINETETEDVIMAVADVEVAKSEDAGSKPDDTDIKKEKLDKPAVRRNKRGYQILEIERNFEVRASEKEVVASEEQAPAASDEAKKQTPASADVKTEVKGLDAKRLEDLRKAAASRFKEKGAAWGGIKKQKVSPIKEELKQKYQPKK